MAKVIPTAEWGRLSAAIRAAIAYEEAWSSSDPFNPLISLKTRWEVVGEARDALLETVRALKEQPMTDDNLTKLTALLIPKAATALDEAAALEGLSRTDVLNRAIQVYAFILNEQNEGQRLALVDEVGGISWVRLL